MELNGGAIAKIRVPLPACDPVWNRAGFPAHRRRAHTGYPGGHVLGLSPEGASSVSVSALPRTGDGGVRWIQTHRPAGTGISAPCAPLADEPPAGRNSPLNRTLSHSPVHECAVQSDPPFTVSFDINPGLNL
jgi:hypothetical protein